MEAIDERGPARRSADATGSAEAWLGQNWSLLLHAARAILSSGWEVSEVEDVAQEAAVKIWRHWQDASYDPRRGSRGSWAYTIARRQAIDRRRRLQRRRRAEAAGVAAAGAGLPGYQAGDVEALAVERERLAGAWGCLTPGERRTVGLLASGYSFSETAIQLAQPLGTVKTHIRRMRQRLGAGAPPAVDPALTGPALTNPGLTPPSQRRRRVAGA